MLKRKGLLFFAIAGMLAVLITSCAPATTPPPATKSIVIAIPEDPPSFNAIVGDTGYDALVSLKLLEGIVDIYMPDMKYADGSLARRYSKVRNYPAINQAAVKEMHRQVGDLVCDDDGIARRGLLVRHLVLPDGIAGTADIVRFLANAISPNTFLNVMDQYRPCFNACDIRELNRPITRNEYREAIRLAEVAGLCRIEGRAAARH